MPVHTGHAPDEVDSMSSLRKLRRALQEVAGLLADAERPGERSSLDARDASQWEARLETPPSPAPVRRPVLNS